MTKREFLMALNDELYPLSEDERSAAIKYYSDYIDDAGVENLDRVLAELGSPAQVAASIKADGELGRSVPPAGPAGGAAGTGASPSAGPEVRRSGLPVWAVVLLVVLLSPVWLPLLGAAAGLVVGVIGVFIGLICSGVVLVLAGVFLAVMGVVSLFGSPLVGLLVLGIGFILAAVGLLLVMASVFLCATVIPAMVRGVVKICRIPLRGRQNNG